MAQLQRLHCHYPDFDSPKKLRIVFKNQPTADTGGMLRQFFTQVLKEISELFFLGTNQEAPFTTQIFCHLG